MIIRWLKANCLVGSGLKLCNNSFLITNLWFCTFRSSKIDGLLTYSIDMMMRYLQALVIDQHNQLLKDNESIKQLINQMTAARAEREPEIQSLQEAIEQMRLSVSEKQKAAADKQRSNNDIKARISQKKARQVSSAWSCL